MGEGGRAWRAGLPWPGWISWAPSGRCSDREGAWGDDRPAGSALPVCRTAGPGGAEVPPCPNGIPLYDLGGEAQPPGARLNFLSLKLRPLLPTYDFLAEPEGGFV